MFRSAILALLAVSAGASAAGAPAVDAVEASRQRLALLTHEEDALAAKMARDRNALAKLLGALAVFSRDPPPPLLVSPSDARDAVRAMILARAIAPELDARAQALSSEVAVLDRLRRRAAQASGELFAAESALADRQSRLEAVAGDADLMASPNERAAALAEDRAPVPDQILAPAGGRIVVRFGGRLESGLASEGVAFRTGAGAVVRSPAAAVVAYAGPLNGWGDVVILRSGGGSHLVLSGLGRVSVAAGQFVAAQAPLGQMPSDGQTPPELYLEFRRPTGPTDPVRLLRGGPDANIRAVAP